MSTHNSRSTAGIIIIGDEILKGQTQDTNSYFLCKALYALGVQVRQVSVIPDDVDIIASEVAKFASTFTFVLTSGGIGPTHDDVTYIGIAKAFGDELIQHDVLRRTWAKLCGRQAMDKDAVSKMSAVPKSAQLHLLNGCDKSFQFPIISVRNVYVFPGIPSYLEHCFSLLRNVFFQAGSNLFHQRTIYVDVNEFQITNVLNKAVQLFEGRVRFGSYPNLESGLYRVKLTLEADSEDAVVEAETFLRANLPKNSVVTIGNPVAQECVERIFDLVEGKHVDYTLSNELIALIRDSIAILRDCFQQYSEETFCVSFNGGKDCTLLLYLTYIALHKKWKDESKPLKPLRTLYIKLPDPFPETEQFIQDCIERYNLELLTYEGPIKEALEKLQSDHPEIKAILMGTRQSDPRSEKLQPFRPTDSGWPMFMRVHPLLHWSFHDVWAFLRVFDVPYCSLYDQGYTSLGCKSNTKPNPKLQVTSSDGSVTYLPAYMLSDPSEERNGRC